MLGQRQPERAAPAVPGEQRATAETEGGPDVRGDVTLIVVKEVHKHRHYHSPDFVGRGVGYGNVTKQSEFVVSTK